MTTPFAICPGCQRHVRASESDCPFCGLVRVCPAPRPAMAGPATVALSVALLALGCKDRDRPVAETTGVDTAAGGSSGGSGMTGAMRRPDSAPSAAGAGGGAGASGTSGQAGSAGATTAPSASPPVSPVSPTATATTTQPVRPRPAARYGMAPHWRKPVDF